MARLTQEDVDLFDEVRRLQQQLREKEARIARLEQCLTERDGGAHDVDCKAYTRSDESLCRCGHNYTVEVLNESPQQSLAHIQADAVLGFAKEAAKCDGLRWNGVEDDAMEYAQQLRDKANEKL